MAKASAGRVGKKKIEKALDREKVTLAEAQALVDRLKGEAEEANKSSLEGGLKLDLGCGVDRLGPDGKKVGGKKDGFLGVDSMKGPGVDAVCNLAEATWAFDNEKALPGLVLFHQNPRLWKLPDNSVSEVHCSHFLEHLTGPQRALFCSELYRVMREGAKATIITPHWSNERAYGDITHQWPPVTGFFHYYLSYDWRKMNAAHLLQSLRCNFEVGWGQSFGGIWHTKSEEARAYALNHYVNVAVDQIATWTKKAPPPSWD